MSWKANLSAILVALLLSGLFIWAVKAFNI